MDPTRAISWQKSRILESIDNLEQLLADLLAPKLERFRDHIELIAHRVVHRSKLIEPNLEATLQELIPLVPLHAQPTGSAWAGLSLSLGNVGYPMCLL